MKKPIVILILFVLVAILIAGVVWVRSRQGTASVSPQQTQTLTQQFTLNPQSQWLPAGPTQERLAKVGMDKAPINLKVDSDTQGIISWFLDTQNNKISGYGFTANLGAIDIHIYLSPSVLQKPKRDILVEVNRNYVTALYAVAESFEDPSTRSYKRSASDAFGEFKALVKYPEQYPVQFK